MTWTVKAKRERDQLFQLAWMAHNYSEALIEIAAGFGPHRDGPRCNYCDRVMRGGCQQSCPGLIARRALGVA